MDDILITGGDAVEIHQLTTALSGQFEMKELGQLKYFLGIEVAYSKEGISLSQHKYTLDLLQETGQLGCKPTSTPLDVNVKIGKGDDGAAVDKAFYQRLIGKLIYLNHTRPDISYGVSLLSQFMSEPYEVHLRAAYKILSYLKFTVGQGPPLHPGRRPIVRRLHRFGLGRLSDRSSVYIGLLHFPGR